jgi:predicted AlkP superfamily phosphohydrolase/phosphomutase
MSAGRTKKERVVLISIDGCNASLVQSFAAAGHLPNIARLLANDARAVVENPYGLLVGAVWANFATAQKTERHQFYCWEGIDHRNYRKKFVYPEFTKTYPNFWKTISDQGKRVCVVDIPHAPVDVLNGVSISEWGCHDRHFGFRTHPPERARQIHETIDLHPVMSLRPYEPEHFSPDDEYCRAGEHRTDDEQVALAEGLATGADRRRRLINSLLQEEPWDLFMAVYSEVHAAGHQMWHLHDVTHPKHNPALVERLGGDPMLSLLKGIDTAIGEHKAAAGADATFCLLMSHGMGPHVDGTHLLEELLDRLNADFTRGGRTLSNSEPAPKPAKAPLAALKKRISARLPRRLRELAWSLNEAVFEGPLRAKKLFFMQPNNTVFGGVRLNLKGREPKGLIDPKNADAFCHRIEEELLALRDVSTGEPIVRSVTRTDAHHARSATDEFPDLLIDWERDRIPEKVWSETVGLVERPYTHWRTGDHRLDGLLLASGPGLGSGRQATLATEDIGASIAARLGVGLGKVDGRPAGWFATTASVPQETRANTRPEYAR